MSKIIFRTDSIFDTDCLFIVNPVNLLGISGKGLASDVAKRHPEILKIYKDSTKCFRLKESGRNSNYIDCLSNNRVPQLYIGSVIKAMVDEHKGYYGYILFFPTKMHYKNNSSISYIEAGLRAINNSQLAITSLALPLLGCGLGGLEPKAVIRLLVKRLVNSNIPKIEIFVTDELLGYSKKVLEKSSL